MPEQFDLPEPPAHIDAMILRAANAEKHWVPFSGKLVVRMKPDGLLPLLRNKYGLK